MIALAVSDKGLVEPTLAKPALADVACPYDLVRISESVLRNSKP